MIKEFHSSKKGTFVREIVRFKIISGPMAGEIIERKCSMKHRNSWLRTLMPGNPTPFRIVRQIEKDLFEIEPTGLY